MRGQPGGKWSDTGFLIILRSFWGPSAALTLSLCRSWTKIEQEKKEWLKDELRRSSGQKQYEGKKDWLLYTLPTQRSTTHLCTFCTESFQNLQFTHKATEAGKGSWDASLWVDLYQGVFLCVDVNLQQTCPVQWTVHQHEQTLEKEVRLKLFLWPFITGTYQRTEHKKPAHL